MHQKNKSPIFVATVAFLALLFFASLPINKELSEEKKEHNLIQKTFLTGAAVTYARVEVFRIKTGDTTGTISWENLDGSSVSLPFAADGSGAAGASETEAIFLGSDPRGTPDEFVYLEGETCLGIVSVTDCQDAEFLAVKNKEAHLLKITTINTEKNEISFEDKTYQTESNNNVYVDGAATSFQVGDFSITLTINEATNQVIFTTTGSMNGAVIELYDKATLKIVNTNIASQSFEGFQFSEYNDGALAPEKYIGHGGTAPLLIQVFYDDLFDGSLEIDDNLLTDLGKTQGSGWYSEESKTSFYSSKGTLFTYDEKEKHIFTIGHITSTRAAQKKVQPSEPVGWIVYAVDKEGDVGKDSSFVLDSEGYAHISYFDETNDALKYAYETAEGFYVQTVDTGNVGRVSDIVLDPAGLPHIVYTDDANKKLKYAVFDNAAWKRWTIEEAGDTALLPALAVDKNTNIHIAYYDYIVHDLIYLFHDQKEQQWRKEIADAEGDVGADAAIAVDGNNYPHIVYVDNQYDSLKYAWYDGVAWQKTVLDATGTAGLFSSIALDENNHPLIWYYNRLEDKVMYLKYVGGTQWEQKTFRLEGVDIWRGDIFLDEKWYAHFTYYDKTEKDLRYALGVWEE